MTDRSDSLPCDHPLTRDAPVLLFDGVCHLCSGWAGFVIRNDPDGVVKLATVQSVSGQEILRALGMPTDTFDTLVFVEDGRAWFRSAAVLRILRHMRRRWQFARALAIVPAGLRDACYDVIARNRYRWFGKRETCLLPTPDIARRFLP